MGARRGQKPKRAGVPRTLAPTAAEMEAAKFGVIYADPPWKYFTDLGPIARNPDRHYPTMERSAIEAIPVGGWAKKDCVLALWTPPPHVEDALIVMRAWGFEYKTKIPWHKTTPDDPFGPYQGFGPWVMQAHEDLLIGVKGAPGVRTRTEGKGMLAFLRGEGGLEDISFWYPRSKVHSRKPYPLYRYLMSFPGRHLELFATRLIKGWWGVGLDLGTRLTPGGVEDAPVGEAQSSLFVA